LLLTGLAHTTAHVWTFVLENGMVGLREFAMNAMKQARSPDPLQPSLWRQFRMFSLSFSLLLLFTGGANILLARIRTSKETLRTFALFGTVFWTVAFIPFAFVDPVIQAIVVAVIAVPLHAIAYVTASIAAETGDTDEHDRTP
jgi:hypothetical protein